MTNRIQDCSPPQLESFLSLVIPCSVLIPVKCFQCLNEIQEACSLGEIWLEQYKPVKLNKGIFAGFEGAPIAEQCRQVNWNVSEREERATLALPQLLRILSLIWRLLYSTAKDSAGRLSCGELLLHMNRICGMNREPRQTLRASGG